MVRLSAFNASTGSLNTMMTSTLETNTDAECDSAYLREALHALPLCIEHCECPDHWHPLWAGLKAAGVRRNLHDQGGFLTALLAPYRTRVGRVMIAGAADTGSLEVLHAALDDARTRYEVIDRCEAPLRLVRERAGELGLDLVARHDQLESVRASEPWDMVFIHYTLGFMSTSARQQFLRHLRQDMAGTGVVVCAVREHAALDASEAANEFTRAMQPMAQQLTRTFADYPELLAKLTHWLPDYASSRQQRQSHTPSFAQLMAEFDAAGFTVLEAHRNPGEQPDAGPTKYSQGSVARWMAVLTIKGAPQ